MKKTIFLMIVVLLSLSVSAQVMRSEDLEKYAKEKYGEKWVDAAKNLSSSLSLDKNLSLSYVQVVDCPNKTKEQLYIALNHWASASFNDANSVIQLNDKESGCIIAQAYIDGIATHMGGMNRYNINIRPIIKIDIKDNKIRVTYTVQYYDVVKMWGGGIMGAMSNARAKKELEKWPLNKCYPFIEKDKHKKTSSKALIMTHAFSNVIIDKIEEAVKNGIVGNEGDDW